MPPTADRPLRVCDVCNQADTAPRHVQPRAGQLMLTRHHDCCAAQGCEVCIATQAITGDAKNDELLAAIQSGVLDDVEV